MLKIKDMNSSNVIRQGDSQPREYQLDTGNLNLNLTNKSATIRLMTADFQGIAYETTATVSSENKISFSIDDIIPAREYRLEITVDDYVFPSRATDGRFDIDPSSHGQEVNIIQVIGKDEIVRDVKEQVEDGLQPFLGEISQAELARQEAEGKREETYEKVKDLPEAFQNVIDETTGKDVISAPEIIAARRGKANLGAKVDEVDAQLSQIERVKIGGGVKGSLSDFDEETLNFIHDGTGGPIEIGSRPEDYSVGPKQTTFIKVSSNLLNVNEREDGYRTNVSDGSLESHVQFAVSDFIPVNPNKKYTMYGAERYSLYDNNKNHISSEMWNYPTDIKTITTTEDTRFIRVSFRQEAHNSVYTEVRLNEGGELLPYEPVYKPKLDSDKVIIEQTVTEELLSDEIKSILYDGTGIPNDSIGLEKTTFYGPSRNMYHGTLVPGVVNTLLSRFNIDNQTPNAGTCIISIEPNETYTIKLHGDNADRTRYAVVNSEPVIGMSLDRVLFNGGSSPSKEPVTFTNTSEGRYLLVYLSTTGAEVLCQVEKGEQASAYTPPKVIKKEYIQPVPVTSENITEKAVKPYHTSFVKGGGKYNLFDGQYIRLYIENGVLHRNPNYDIGHGFILPIEGGNNYYINKDDSNRFHVGFHKTEIDLTDATSASNGVRLDYPINSPELGQPIHAPHDAKYLVAHVSSIVEDPPRTQVTQNIDRPFFLGYGIEMSFADGSIKTRALEDGNLFGQLIENYKNQGSSSQNFHFLGDIDTIFKSSDNLTQVDLGTSQKVYDNYDLLVSNFPNYVKRNTEGIDSNGRNMYSYDFIAPSIGNQSTNSPNRLKLIFTTGVHGGEKQTVLAAYRFFHELCNNPRNLEELEVLKWNIDFKIIPVANPTGYDGLSNNPRNNMDGTNLNRNFPVRWSYFPHGNSDYGGEQPMDAIESQVIDNWLKENLDAFYYIDYHSHPFADPAIYVESDLSATISQSVLRHYERRWRELNDEGEDYSLSAYILNPGRGFIVGHAHDLGLNILLPECPNFGFSSSPLVQQRIVYEYFVNTILTVLKSF